jgi:hypothetical protein
MPARCFSSGGWLAPTFQSVKVSRRGKGSECKQIR